MEIKETFEGENLVFSLSGELDEHSAEFVRNRLDAEIEQKQFKSVIFDLSRLSFMDSTGIGVVIGRYKLARRKQKDVFVRSPSNTVDKIFKMSGLYEIIRKI